MQQRSTSGHRSSSLASGVGHSSVRQESIRDEGSIHEEHQDENSPTDRHFGGGFGSRSRSGSERSGAGGQRRWSSGTHTPRQSRVGFESVDNTTTRRAAPRIPPGADSAYKAAENRRLRRQQATLKSLGMGVNCP
eukprot:Hpha_TRINITY_DN15770_c5_g5::TRINITY_DN15770_c5_g5_i1::g.41305::m.41305